MATEGGLAIWSPPEGEATEGTWTTYEVENSGLPDDRVLSLAEGGDGSLWVGTDAGAARYLDGDWTTFDAGDLGRAEARIWDLAVDGAGRIWAATSEGALRYDGTDWEPVTSANSGLLGDFVFVIESDPQGERLYFGTDAGLSALSTEAGTWERLTPPEMDVGQGVSALVVDGEGPIWAGTLGRGLGRWEGEEWDFYRTGGSPLPFNRVTSLFEEPSGLLWVGTGRAAQSGGAVSTFDGEDWHTFKPENSGYLGAEPLAMAQVSDFFGRGEALLIGTRTFGVAVYQPR
jgi:ligand-binding sensor domain-containing protein